MARCVALVILALALNAAPLHAQTAVFTVTVQAANVHKEPALASPVIGRASRHTVLRVTRRLGNWAGVFWADSPNGLGYIHVTTGRIGAPAANTRVAGMSARPPAARPVAPAGVTAPAPKSSAAPMPTTAQRTPVGDRVAYIVPQVGPRISHVVGVGGIVGSVSSWGATSRWWRDRHVGVEAAITRGAMTSDVAPGRVTSMQIEPAVVYAPYDYVPGYVSMRPYVGSGLTFHRQTLKDALGESTSDSGLGYHLFGGTELTFASVTRFGLSAEVGYRHLPTPFAGFEPDRFGVAIAGHWYFK